MGDYVSDRPTAIRRTSRKVTKWMADEGFACRADCGRPLERGQLAVVEERTSFYVNANRFHVWHHACHPATVDRNFRRLVKRALETGTTLAS